MFLNIENNREIQLMSASGLPMHTHIHTHKGTHMLMYTYVHPSPPHI